MRKALCRSITSAASGLALLLVSGQARADGPPTALVYLDGSGAPAPFSSRIEERLRAALSDRGISIADSAAPATSASDAKVAAARKDLEKGIAAYRDLSLDSAVTSLNGAEAGALGAADTADAASVIADARLYLGLIALANGSASEADKLLRRSAVLDPERKLESRAFPPDVIAAYEKARKAVLAGPSGELTVVADPEGLAVLVDGRPLNGPMKLPYGEHLLCASGDVGSAGTRIDIAAPKEARTLHVQADPSRALGAARAAARRGDDSGLGRSLDQVAVASGAGRVLVWDLRSNAGHIEALMRFRDVPGHSFSKPAIADLGNAVTVDAPLKSAVATLLTPIAVAMDPVPVPIRSVRTRHPARKIGWAWWVGGGIALLAAGGTAAALAQPPKPGDSLSVHVQR